MPCLLARWSPFLLAAGLGVALAPRTARAESFVVVRDDGTMANSSSTPKQLRDEMLARYAETGLPMPEVMSVWTTFPLLGNNYATYIDPRGSEANGIGIPKHTSPQAPLNALTYHNNVLVMQDRADKSRAPLEGFSSYLFLLEFSHQWGPNIDVPMPNPGSLEGFPYHWSFFLEGTSPAGGNPWTDNGDGTFTVVPHAPKDVAYTPLDLYLMGMAPPSEVAPFAVLEDAVVPTTPTDPLWGGAFAPHSFPWFDTTNAPITVTATRRLLTIDDVVAANGPRDPAAVAARTFTVSILLAVPADATDDDIAAASAVFEPMAADFAPAFHRATSERGTLDILTVTQPGTGGAGGGGGSSTTTTSGGHTTPPTTESCACTTAGGADDDANAYVSIGLFALAVARASKRRARATG